MNVFFQPQLAASQTVLTWPPQGALLFRFNCCCCCKGQQATQRPSMLSHKYFRALTTLLHIYIFFFKCCATLVGGSGTKHLLASFSAHMAYE